MQRAVLDLARPEITCTRVEFTAGGERYVLTGENTELFPRRAVPATPGRPGRFLVPIRDLSKAVAAGLGVQMKYTPGASYALLRLTDEVATAVRVYKKIPTDDVLAADMAMILETGGQPFARKVHPDGEVAIVVSAPKD